MKKYLPLLLIFLFLVSILGNIAFFLADGVTYLRLRELADKNNTTYQICASIEEFRKLVFDENKKILFSGNRPEAPRFPNAVFDRIKYNLGIDNDAFPFFYWGETNWLLTATLEDAILHKDEECIKQIETLFEDKIENYPIENVHQCMGGGVAILLHQRTGKEKYKAFADKMFEWCKIHDTQYGVLFAPINAQIIDGYGMFLPFINRYAKAYNDTTALNFAVKHVEIAAKYFIDDVGGLPSHIFSLSNSHVKHGSCNWGRGTSWFLSGLVDIDYSMLSDSALVQINKMDIALLSILKEFGQFNQFIGEQGEIDLTATLPILYYLSHKKLVKLTDKDLLIYSRYSDNGLLYHSSGSNSGSHGYCKYFGPNVFAQAFMLKLLNERN